MGMLKILAKRGELVPLCEEVRKGETQRERERVRGTIYTCLSQLQAKKKKSLKVAENKTNQVK